MQALLQKETHDYMYLRLKTDKRDKYITDKHCDFQNRKHENTVLSVEREATACVSTAILIRMSQG